MWGNGWNRGVEGWWSTSLWALAAGGRCRGRHLARVGMLLR
jgi:hypothetical protein